MIATHSVNRQNSSFYTALSFEANYSFDASKLAKRIGDVFYRIIVSTLMFCAKPFVELASKAISCFAPSSSVKLQKPTKSIQESQEEWNKTWVNFYLKPEHAAGIPSYSSFLNRIKDKDILADQGEKKEQANATIRFMFPVADSQDPEYPIVNKNLLDLFKGLDKTGQQQVNENFLNLFGHVLTAYGFEIKNLEQFKKDFKACRISVDFDKWFNEPWLAQKEDHFNRFTRILNSLSSLGWNPHPEAFYSALLNLSRSSKNNNNEVITLQNLQEWRIAAGATSSL